MTDPGSATRHPPRAPSSVLVVDANIILSVVLGRRSRPVFEQVVAERTVVTSARAAEEVREHGGVKHAVGELLTCPFCLAQWVGTGFVLGYVTAPRATRLAALTMTMVAGSDVLQFIYDAIQNGGLQTGTDADDAPEPNTVAPGPAGTRR